MVLGYFVVLYFSYLAVTASNSGRIELAKTWADASKDRRTLAPKLSRSGSNSSFLTGTIALGYDLLGF